MMTGIIFRNAVTVTVEMEGREDDRLPIVGLLDNSGTNELDLPAPPQPFRKETVGRSLARCLVFQQKNYFFLNLTYGPH